jgi:hypothetical protein
MKRPVISLISVLAATGYSAFIVSTLVNAFNETTADSTSDAEIAGAAIGVSLFLPHVAIVGIGVLLNWIGYAIKMPALTLTAAILYSVGALFGILYILFIAPIIVLSFVAFAQERKRKKAAKEE